MRYDFVVSIIVIAIAMGMIGFAITTKYKETHEPYVFSDAQWKRYIGLRD